LGQEIEPNEPIELPQGALSFSVDVGESTVTIYDATPGIRIESSIGPLPEQRAELYMSKLLQANLFGQMTRRSVLGLNEMGDKVVLQLYLPIVRNYKEFHEQLEDFVNALQFWQKEAQLPE
jgi:hypothetical protein